MAVDEAARHQPYNDLAKGRGTRVDRHMVELLPPVGWADVATRQDLDALGHRVDARVADLRAEISGLGSDLRVEMAAGHRQLLFAMLGSMFTLAGLMWAMVGTFG